MVVWIDFVVQVMIGQGCYYFVGVYVGIGVGVGLEYIYWEMLYEVFLQQLQVGFGDCFVYWCIQLLQGDVCLCCCGFGQQQGVDEGLGYVLVVDWEVVYCVLGLGVIEGGCWDCQFVYVVVFDVGVSYFGFFVVGD